MVDYQVPLLGLARNFNDLTEEEREFIEYFAAIDSKSISPLVDCYSDIGPQGYGTSLILARIVKVKERILSDRQLAKVLKQNDLYWFVTYDAQSSHNTQSVTSEKVPSLPQIWIPRNGPTLSPIASWVQPPSTNFIVVPTRSSWT